MLAITDIRISEKIKDALHARGFDILLMPPMPCLSSPVASHPDMLMFMGYDRIVCHASYYEENKDLIDRIADTSHITLTLSHEQINAKYPADVLFNCLTLKGGDILLCNTKTVSPMILDLAREHSATILHTNQGYTKCSVCKVDEDSIITSDMSIHNICMKNNINSLLVSPACVALEGVSCGFIGGASGSDGKNTYFCGDISSHPDAKKILKFCSEHDRPAVSLADTPLYDFGTVFFV